MEYSRNEIKAGLMVMISIIVLFVFIILISGLNIMKSTKTYFTRFQHSNGIVVGSIVRYAGMEVGKVTAVILPEDDNTKVEFTLTVDEKAPIKVDSEAFISSIGILGDYYVEITSGSLNKPYLTPGSQIKGRDMTQIMQLTEPIENISLKLQDLLERVNKLVSEQSQYHIASIIAQLDTLLLQNRDNVSLTISNLQRMSENLEKVSDRLDTMLDSEHLDLGRTAQKIDETVEKMQHLIETTNGTITHVDQSLVSRETQLTEIMENMQDITENLNQFSQTIKEQPWSLVRISKPKERKIQRDD
ncbi:MCE family protein [candidate division KSB1 bacterium]|nr:MCE family protein [candidate division KSB1 bacterium]